VSKNIDQRRVYIDFNDNTIYSVNTQYGGNTIGLKKLAMRLAINKAAKDKESWLTEHMFIMGVCGPNNRVTYFTGAYPSGCGKTSTAMLEGERLIGDDIAYLREVKGKVRAINPECGIFGIIRDVSASNDPLIWYALTSSNREVIFSNVLVNEGFPYWMGMGGDISIPERGLNHSSSFFGEWWKGKRNPDNDEIPLSHPNGRYTIKIDGLKNKDGRIDDPEGVEIKGIIYGGRDSDTWLPVEEAFNWEHGILTKGAILESETTATTLGKVGVRKFNPMSNLDFLSISIGTYIKMNLEFGKKLDTPPSIFSVNYFLKDRDGKGMPLSGIHDKRVWLKWMELRVHGDVAAIKTPTGYIPQYNDLKRLFKEVLQKDYSEEDYTKQFTLRIGQNMAKIERTCKIYREDVPDALGVLFDALEEQKQRLKAVRAKYGDYVAPDVFT
jgi:phosphoenolpyruvate carboxykinase (GTP)